MIGKRRHVDIRWVHKFLSFAGVEVLWTSCATGKRKRHANCNTKSHTDSETDSSLGLFCYDSRVNSLWRGKHMKLPRRTFRICGDVD
eukprot:m.82329 g.82329  ORF g.82329 m.82329 type:complete len:87 (+) comp25509_c0_seq1:2261-2521(+)